MNISLTVRKNISKDVLRDLTYPQVLIENTKEAVLKVVSQVASSFEHGEISVKQYSDSERSELIIYSTVCFKVPDNE